MATELKENHTPIDSEQKKYLIDLFKHQTTLCTATILLTMAVAGNFIPQPMTFPVKTYLGLSIILFLGSLFLSFTSLVELVTGIENHRQWKLWMYLSFISFISGIVILGLIILLA